MEKLHETGIKKLKTSDFVGVRGKNVVFFIELVPFELVFLVAFRFFIKKPIWHDEDSTVVFTRDGDLADEILRIRSVIDLNINVWSVGIKLDEVVVIKADDMVINIGSPKSRSSKNRTPGRKKERTPIGAVEHMVLFGKVLKILLERVKRESGGDYFIEEWGISGHIEGPSLGIVRKPIRI